MTRTESTKFYSVEYDFIEHERWGRTPMMIVMRIKTREEAEKIAAELDDAEIVEYIEEKLS